MTFLQFPDISAHLTLPVAQGAQVFKDKVMRFFSHGLKLSCFQTTVAGNG
ncbi:MAG: hypothetical protein ABSH32_26180 [Bryobacteraceae bacterium]